MAKLGFLYSNQYSRVILLNLYRMIMVFKPGLVEKKIFVNSIPKAGTHLTTALLTEVPGVINSGIHIRTFEVNSQAKSPVENIQYKFNCEAFVKKLKYMRRGQIATGHLPYDKETVDALVNSDYYVLFMVRNPKDILFSEFYYINKLERHFAHDWLVGYKTKEEQIKALLEGKPNLMPSFSERLERFFGWLDNPHVLTVRFEELVGSKGGGYDASQASFLADVNKALGFPMGEADIGNAMENIKSKGSFTMRSGQLNGWKNEFDTIGKDLQRMIDEQLYSSSEKFGYC